MDDITRRNATLCFLQGMYYYWQGDNSRANYCVMEGLTWSYPVGLLISQTLN